MYDNFGIMTIWKFYKIKCITGEISLNQKTGLFSQHQINFKYKNQSVIIIFYYFGKYSKKCCDESKTTF